MKSSKDTVPGMKALQVWYGMVSRSVGYDILYATLYELFDPIARVTVSTSVRYHIYHVGKSTISIAYSSFVGTGGLCR